MPDSQHIRIKLHHKSSVLTLALVLALASGCSKQLELLSSVPGSDNRQLPFERTAVTTGVSPTSRLLPAVVPVGTTVVIRLNTRLSSASSHAGDSFEATLDQPISVKGEAVASIGSEVRGNVTAVAPPRLEHSPGYLRLTLSSVRIGDKTLVLHTSSVFAKGTKLGNDTKLSRANAEFSTARRLTFHLLDTLSLPSQNTAVASIPGRRP